MTYFVYILYSESIDRYYKGHTNTKLFLPVKKHFNFDPEYTIYSFRHSAIGNMFSKKVEELKKVNEPNYINKSIEFIRQFTNHKSNAQTKQYLRDITTEVHVDWSDYL